MPVVRIHTNIAVADKTALIKKASAMVAAALSKPESYVMVMAEDEQALCFAGSDEAAAYLEVKSLGLTTGQTALLSDTICTFIDSELGIDPARTYIEFAAPERAMFGWNKGTF